MDRIDRAVRVFPILPHKEDKFRALATEMKRRYRRTREFYGKYGVTRETWHLQQTADGEWLAVGVTEAPRLRSVAKKYGASADETDAWLKGKIREITGIDLDRQPLGPPTETIFDWSQS